MWWTFDLISFFISPFKSDFTTDWKISKEMAKINKKKKKNQHKISKISKELNKLKELKISDDIKKILQVELCNKRCGLDRTMNKSKGIKKPSF